MKRLFQILSAFLILSVKARANAAGNETFQIASFEARPYVSSDKENPGFLYEIVQAASLAGGLRSDIQILPEMRARKQALSGENTAIFPLVTLGDKDYLYSDELYSVNEAVLTPSSTESPPTPSPTNVFLYNEDSIGKTIDMVNMGRLQSHTVDPNVTAEIIITRRAALTEKLRIHTRPIKRGYALGMAASSPLAASRLKAFNEGLRKIKKNGAYEAILRRYGYMLFSAKPGVLNIAAPDNYDAESLKRLSTVFATENPGTTFHWHFMPQTLLRKRVASSLLFDVPAFDAFSLEAMDLLSQRNDRALAAFDRDLVEAANINDLYPAVMFGVKWDDRVYALPYRVFTNVTYYRKDLFDVKKLVMPAEPSFADIERFAKILHAPDKGVSGICMPGSEQDSELSWMLRGLIFSQESDFMESVHKAEIADPRYNAVIRRYTDLLLRYGPPNSYRLGQVENRRAFAQGSCAIWLGPSTDAEQIFDARLTSVSAKAAVTDPPFLREEHLKRRMYYNAFAVSAYSVNRRLAQRYLAWTLSREYEQLLREREGWLRARIGLRPSLIRSGKLQKLLPFFKPLIYTFENFGFTLSNNNVTEYEKRVRLANMRISPTFSEILSQVVSRVLKGEATVDKSMLLAQRKLKAVIYQSRDTAGGKALGKGNRGL